MTYWMLGDYAGLTQLGRLCKGVCGPEPRHHLSGVRRYELTDEQWQRLAPLLLPQRPRTGRPNHNHRTIINGILWVLRTGAPWADLPERYGPVGTVSSRFYRWRAAGLWQRVLEALQAQADAAGLLDWDLHFVDASVVRAHQHAAGARRTGAIGG
jgi:transposase